MRDRYMILYACIICYNKEKNVEYDAKEII